MSAAISRIISFLIAVISFFAGFSSTPRETAYKLKALETADGMTLEEKVGQLFIVMPETLIGVSEKASLIGSYSAGATAYEAAMGHAIEKYHPGGIVFFYKNILNEAQIKKYISDLQSASRLPLFIAVDEEGGSVARIGNNPAFSVPTYKSMAAIGSTGNPVNAYNVGLNIGKYLKKYGFNLDFAPVADVNSNPKNTVIGSRSFGSDPAAVGKMVASAINGFHDSGIMTTSKHFPGHGDTTNDTHSGYVSVTKTWAQMLQTEIVPFKAAIEAGTDLIMTAHITCKNVSADGLPASLSYKLITEKLRGELGFDGVVITDAMNMGAICNNYTSSEAAVAAINAGVDIVLAPYNYDAAFSGVLAAVKNGTITAKRLNESVVRILTLKAKYGLL